MADNENGNDGGEFKADGAKAALDSMGDAAEYSKFAQKYRDETKHVLDAVGKSIEGKTPIDPKDAAKLVVLLFLGNGLAVMAPEHITDFVTAAACVVLHEKVDKAAGVNAPTTSTVQ